MMEGKGVWIAVGVVVLLVVVLMLRGGGSSTPAATVTPIGPTAAQAGIETARLQAASSAFSAYENAGVAALQSNNAVTINSQDTQAAESINATNVFGSEALANEEGSVYEDLANTQAQNNLALAKVKAKTQTNQSILGLIGGLFTDVTKIATGGAAGAGSAASGLF